MAIMINCAQDWTFDKFAEDMRKARPLPLKRGVYPPADMPAGVRLCTFLKTAAHFYRLEVFEGKEVDTSWGHTYVGDAFLRSEEFADLYFSDWYKDVYNQRPHFADWYILQLLGMSSDEDVCRKWSGFSVESLEEQARETREALYRAFEER